MQVHVNRRTVARGFTLIELLVVVAIISLLISVLLPSLTQARQVARMVRCQANLKQFGNSSQMYANDADDWYVAHRMNNYGLIWYSNLRWRQIMGLQVGGTLLFPEGLVCPQVPPDRPPGSIPYSYGHNGHSDGNQARAAKAGIPFREPDAPWREGDYKVNKNGSGVGIAIRLFRSKVRNPSSKIHFIDASDWNIGRSGANWQVRWDIFGEAKAGSGKFGGGMNGTTTYRHFEGNNPLMHDGHVENRPKAEVYYFNANGKYNATKTEALWHIYK